MKENKFFKMKNKFRAFFKMDDLKTTTKKELIGGLTTFLAGVYLLSVEPNMLSSSPSINGMDDPTLNMAKGGIFLSTIIVMFIGTFIMCLISNMPAVISPGMGINAVFTFSVARSVGYEGALISVMISSILLCAISCTGLRMLIINSIPDSIKYAIGAGIGLFVAYLGLKGIKFVEESNGVPVAALSDFSQYYPSIILGFSILAIILFFHFRKIPGAIAIAIFIGLAIAIVFANTLPNSEIVNKNFGSAKWKGWKYDDFNGFAINLKSTYQAFVNPEIWTNTTFYISIFIFIFVCFFDATGAIYSLSQQISEQTEGGYKVNNRALLGDAIAGVPAGFLGLSATTTLVESSAGISQGARTGLSGMFASTLFLSAIALYPLFEMIPVSVSSASLIFVGSLMIVQIKEIEWVKPEIAFASFLTMLCMVITFSITNGIAVGFIMYSLVSLVSKKGKEVHWMIYVLSILFIFYFALQSFI
ncbi:NCS2 family permease [Spiroplasma endosymbiont of Othius punctulatus]|uniref:NCS2 family permease n=1 Tax=Spiroplasma endosymbiont of Othius punctulatus TaxID=3066289 RepID=UPI0030CD4387